MLHYLNRVHNLPEDVASYYISKCGTRVRVLQSLGEMYSLNVTKKKNIQDLVIRYESAIITFKLLFPEITDILKRVYSSEKVYFRDLPQSLNKVNIDKILYVGPGSQLFFEEKIIENIVGKSFENI
jgi:hypothetical protein